MDNFSVDKFGERNFVGGWGGGAKFGVKILGDKFRWTNYSGQISVGKFRCPNFGGRISMDKFRGAKIR